MADRRCVIKGRQKFMDYFQDVKRTAIRTKAEFHENYPPRIGCVESFVERLLDHEGSGYEFVLDMIHFPTWEQCFGDGNHRTTTLLALAFLDGEGVYAPYDGDLDAMASRLESWVTDSKKWIGRRRSFDWPKDSAARNHRGTARTWMKASVGPDYTSRLTSVGPRRLRTFFSCSEKRGRG